MRAFSTLLCLLLASGLLAGEEKASRLAREAQKAEHAGEIVRAYLLYSEAAALDPANSTYWFRSQALRTRAVLQAKPGPAGVFTDKEFGGHAGAGTGAYTPTAGVTAKELEEASKPQPPKELKAFPGRKSLDFRGDARSLFEQVARTFHLEAVFDGDYQPGSSFRFRMDEADYREALYALEAATASFLVPLGERLFLVAKDTPQKRAEVEPTVTVVIPIPELVSLQEAQELVQAAQQTMGIQRIGVDSQHRLVVLKDRISKVRPAQQIFHELLHYRPQVAVEVEFLELNRNASSNYGLATPTQFPLVDFGKLWNSIPSIPAGFTRFAVFGGGKTFLGLGITDAELFARMNRSTGRSLLRSEIRSVDGQPASLHVGDRFPVLTGGFLGAVSGLPPSFTFEDLGLMLKITPHVHGIEEVSLDLETEFKVLAGQSINGIPVISNRKFESKVRMRNGQWGVVAGLMNSSEAKAITGLAGLSNLSALGPLFRQDSSSRDTSEILLILKPQLLNLPHGQVVTRALRVGSETHPLTPL